MTNAQTNANSAWNTINSNFSYLDISKPNVVSATNSTALSPSDGECSWNISHSLNTKNILCSVYEVSSGKEIIKNLIINSSSSITIKLKSSSSIFIGSLKAVIIGI